MLIKDIQETIIKLERESNPDDQELIDFYKLALHTIAEEQLNYTSTMQ